MITTGLILLLFCSIYATTGHEETSNQSGVEVTDGLLTTAEKLFDLICSCHENDNRDSSSQSSTVNLSSNPSDCSDIKELGFTKSGRYNIFPSSFGVSDVPVEVWCDMDTLGGGWTVIQRREDGSVDFNGTWADYKTGFGYAGSEFWLGNDNIHTITNQKLYELQIELELWNGSQIMTPDYHHFRLGDQSSKYILFIESSGQSPTSHTHLDVCNSKLGMEDGRIKDSQITASSTWPSQSVQVANARLNRPGNWPIYAGSWCAATNNINQWIQVSLNDSQMLGGIITQGRSSSMGRDPYNQYITKYKVQYSNDGTHWKFVTDDNGQDEEFIGNYDRDTPVTNMFDSPILARFVRIRPTEWNSHISMRLELLGCQGDDRLYGDPLRNQLSYQHFSTMDTSDGCATTGGAWWYNGRPTCSQYGLNGEYLKGSETTNRGITWQDSNGDQYQLKSTEMKIRPVSYKPANE
ncbi:uncharacterized protein [Amphiura filiformis]|uniref:uncharacterized protein n=1 Tax=Amphiura filiformis TaxID=82378 RepID=UPI003B22041C